MEAREPKVILYVDDDPDIREIVHLALRIDPTLTIRTSESGESAIAELDELKPDLVLLDVMMSGLDGIATFRRMRANPETAHIPVIFMTAKVMAREVAQFRDIGALGVISKPFNPLKLRQQIFTLWGNEIRDPLSTQQESLRSRIDELGALFLQRTERDVAAMCLLLPQAAEGEVSALKQLKRLAHSIRGAGATLGFPAISAQALQIERLAESATDHADGPAQKLDGAVRELANVVSQGAHKAVSG